MTSKLNILIIRLSSIGDVLHGTPVPRALKQALPGCHITWVVGQVAADMVRYNPDIDELFVWPREEWEKAMRAGRFREAWQIWQRLRTYFHDKHYDIALDIHGLFLSGMVTAASHAPRRIGLSHTRELNHWFMTETAPPPNGPHVIERYLSILRPLQIQAADPRMTLIIPPAATEFAAAFLPEQGVTPADKVIAVNPATTWKAKNWPPAYFAQVIDAVSPHAKVVLCGGPGDRAIAGQVLQAAKTPVIDAVGRTSLLELAALLERADVLVVGDTGPLHMAIAVGTPSVSIFGATDRRRFGPLDNAHIVLSGEKTCPPCHKTVCPRKTLDCLTSIQPQAVIEKTLALLNA